MLIVQSDSCREEGPAILLLYTFWMKESVAEGALQCSQGVFHGVGVVVHQRRKLGHYSLSQHLKGASQDRASLLYEFVQFPPVRS